MKKIRLKPEPGEFYNISKDLRRIIGTFAHLGYEVSSGMAQALWERYSESYAAPWLSLPEKEGPFVVVNACGSGFRIECQLEGTTKCALPPVDTYGILEKHGLRARKAQTFEEIALSVDWLNQGVKEKTLLLDHEQLIEID